MSADNVISSITSVTGSLQTGINTVSRTTADLGLGGVGSTSKYWKDQLRPASYAGVPFGVLDGAISFGRRNVVHEYPYRDKPWVEDLGRSARRISMTGFLVENAAYGGGSVIAQRDRLIGVCESSNNGELVHPTLGRLKVSNLTCVAQERWDQGRVFELHFSFIESGDKVFPSVATSTTSAVSLSCDAADYAVAQDYSTSVSDSIKQGASVLSTVVSTATNWAQNAQRLVNDATNVVHMVGTVNGNFGRFAGASKAPTTAKGISSALSSAIALGATARTSVATAISNLTNSAGDMQA